MAITFTLPFCAYTKVSIQVHPTLTHTQHMIKLKMPGHLTSTINPITIRWPSEMADPHDHKEVVVQYFVGPYAKTLPQYLLASLYTFEMSTYEKHILWF